MTGKVIREDFNKQNLAGAKAPAGRKDVMIKKPEGCKTPNRVCEEYKLTAHDLAYMQRMADKIDLMLGYYINMVENRTGELAVTGNNCDKLQALSEQLEGIKTVLDEINWR